MAGDVPEVAAPERTPTDVGRPARRSRCNDALDAFAADLPEGSEIELNALAEMAAEAVLHGTEGVAPGPPGEG
jgi:hypothetical protein